MDGIGNAAPMVRYATHAKVIVAPALTICGDSLACGSYLLLARIQKPISVRFGAFRHGVPVPIRAGHAIYIGSAMGRSGSATLSRRLLRHATRTGDAPPHPLQQTLTEHFAAEPPRQKQCRWHIDYLLDRPQVALIAAIVLRSTERLEAALADLIEQESGTEPVASGLGAGDHRGATHLYLHAGPPSGCAAWWQDVAKQACDLAATGETRP